jgi:glutamate-5-semialdehyde dehydrogenase
MTLSPGSTDAEVQAVARQARACSRALRLLPGAQKNACLLAFGAALQQAAESILKAARDDAAHARAHAAPTHVVQALALSRADLESKSRLAATLAGLPEPVGRIESTWMRPNGLKIEKTRVPLGVVAVLAEYDVGAVIDALLLCVKAGDAVALLAGPMVNRTCTAVVRALSAAAVPGQVGAGLVHLVPGHGDQARRALLRQCDLIDVAIPVGSAAWVEAVFGEAWVPVLGQSCRRRHVYVDEDADLSQALAVVADVVTAEALGDGPDVVLVHRAVAPRLLPAVAVLLREKAIPFTVDAGAAGLLADVQLASVVASNSSAGAVHLALVDGVDAAAAVIGEQGSGYSDAILTNDRAVAMRFAALVDSACVYLNASPRFTDGGQFGMGAQVTVSTGRLHARGPLGIDELTTCKYVVTGKGQVLG